VRPILAGAGRVNAAAGAPALLLAVGLFQASDVDLLHLKHLGGRPSGSSKKDRCHAAADRFVSCSEVEGARGERSPGVRVFLAGATGAVGKRLVPLLVGRGHEVVGTTRTPDKIAPLRAAGAEAVVVDGLDRAAVLRAVASARPDVVVHQMTALAGIRNLRRFDDAFAVSNRLRTEGTNHLLDAARAAGVRRFVVQSYTGWPNSSVGGRVKTEEDALDADPPRSMGKTLNAIRRLEGAVLDASDLVGIVLRYGAFYGEGTSLAPGGDLVEAVRQRRLLVIGRGAGVWSFIHIDDAAVATRLAIEGGPSGLYNIVDDDQSPGPIRKSRRQS
jgi:2-alkyl-3-oxoalkanoate reductase